MLQDAVLTPTKTIKYTWNEPDCETLLVDPEGQLYLVSKVQPGDPPKLYLVPQQWPFPEREAEERIPLAGGT